METLKKHKVAIAIAAAVVCVGAVYYLQSKKQSYNQQSQTSSVKIQQNSSDFEEKKNSQKSKKTKVIFQLGTNNWQWSDEAAPGSGILHEAQHNAYNSIDGITAYSIYPSTKHNTSDILNNSNDLIRIYTLNDNIPICESASPVSKRRWHSMSDDEVNEYQNTLQDMVYKYLCDIEAKNGSNCIYFCIAHHTFMNCIILHNVMKKRELNNLSVPVCVAYGHGTGLKMYQNELSKKQPDEYPPKFYPLINKLGIFSNSNQKCYINYVLGNSNKVLKEFNELFPNFPVKNCLLSMAGINKDLFRVVDNLKLNVLLKEFQFKSLHLDNDCKEIIESNTVIGDNIHYDNLIVFVGKLADWKRLDLVLDASEIYNNYFLNKNRRVLTLIIGGGPSENQIHYLKYLSALKNENVFYIGAKTQNILYKLLNVTDIGLFPSKNEPFGMVFIECMACGTPVIGAKSGGPIEFVDNDVGILINEDNNRDNMVKDIANNSIKFIENNFKNKVKNNCIQRANKYDIIGMQKKLLKDLEKLF